MQKTLLIVAIVLHALVSWAHGIDGCSNSSGNYIINQTGNTNFIALQVTFVKSKTTYTNFWGNELKARSLGFNSSLSARGFLNKKLAFSTNIPFLLNTTKTEENTTTISGFGDSKLMLEYLLFFKSTPNTSSRISIMGGFELPTGRVNDQIMLRAFSPGSGSIDLPFTFQYNYSNKKINFFTQGLYQLNTKNANNFKFGNQLSLSAMLYKFKKIDKGVFQLGAGLETILFGNDLFETENGTVNYNNKFNSIGINLEIQYQLKTWLFRANCMIPSITNRSENNIKFYWSTIGISRLIKSRIH